ncbi:MAG TPA: OmpH family outer membrane protein [Bryobacteraceae bacterium]
MKSKLFVGFTLAVATALAANAQGPPTKVAVISIQGAIAATKDGQKAIAELDSKAAPKRKELDQKQTDINNLKDQLNKGANTLSEATKTELYKSIQQKTTSLQRDFEDAQADMDQEQQKILQQLGQKILAVIERYARDNGFAMVVDVSSPQTPVMYASPSIDITKEIIDLYDKNSATMSTPAPATKPATPVVPAAPKPSTPKPPPTKQP